MFNHGLYIRNKLLTKKRVSSFIVALLSVALSACVTQEFENDETPVVKTQANRDDMAATRISLGLGYLRMGNMSQAKQNLEKAKKFSPEMVQVYTAFAHYYETVGENKLAIASFEEALSLKSDDADTLNNYGVFLCRQDQTEAAEKQFLNAIAVPSYILVAKSYENLSSCFLQKDNFDKAEVYLHKAVMHSPGNSSTLLQMVRLQYAMGEYTQAKSYEQRFEKVTRRFSPQSLALAYKIYFKLGQRRTAKNYGTMLVKMYPQSWEAQQYLLNELESIEADSLAKRYKLTQVSEADTKAKKRVVKLSPKKAFSSNAANSSSLDESSVAKPKVLQATRVTALPTTKSTTTVTTNTAVALSSIPAASSSAINAALTMASIETVTPMSNPNDQDKRVVVLVAPKTAGDNIKNTLIAENKANTGVVALVEKDIPLEDREIFQIAKKAVLITEGVPKVEEPLTIDSTQSQSSAGVSNQPPEIHVVIIGDTLFGISKKYNIKISALRRWNNLVGNKKIRINDKLHLIAPETVNK
jgi:type IV pilus assembly protein PilF